MRRTRRNRSSLYQVIAKRPSLLAQLVDTLSGLAVTAAQRARASCPKTTMTSLRLITDDSLSVAVGTRELDAEQQERGSQHGESDENETGVHSGPTASMTLVNDGTSSAR